MRLVLRIIFGFFRFWYDFIIGDAWEIAAGLALVLFVGAEALRLGALPESVIPYLVTSGAALVVLLSVMREFRKKAEARR